MALIHLALSRRELAAVTRLVEQARAALPFELVRAVLFGSRARGDHDAESDIDVLMVFAASADERAGLSGWMAAEAERISRGTGVPLQSWTLTLEDLAPGQRTPMLVDAVADALPVWPPDEPVPVLPFTPADAAFCAECLLGWVDRGSVAARRALAYGRRARAARRVRDDVTRLATAALLVAGDTRHRRLGSLHRFEEKFLGYKEDWDLACLPALRWAAAAYPADGGRGTSRPPPTAIAIATAEPGLF
ncbi:MAG TPA: nucleotidyltransferase domain-containing protein, partial [Longimicrobiales bacterium]|nr:nucleotidyltransferase domain-containing protein [Longimicrobiales bacterium]